MQIDDRRRKPGSGPRLTDGRDDPREAAAVIEMPVRQEHTFDFREINVQAPGIVEPKVGIRTDVEQHAVFLLVSATGDQHREPVTGAAQLVEHSLAFVFFVCTAGWRASRKVNDLGNLWHAIVDARQGVSLIVDNNKYFQFVELHYVARQ
jgi:hypothetical protein